MPDVCVLEMLLLLLFFVSPDVRGPFEVAFKYPVVEFTEEDDLRSEVDFIFEEFTEEDGLRPAVDFTSDDPAMEFTEEDDLRSEVDFTFDDLRSEADFAFEDPEVEFTEEDDLRGGSATPLLLRPEVDFTFEDAEVELLLRSEVELSLDPDEVLILRSDFAFAMDVFWSEIDFSPEIESLLLLPLVACSR
jgi:hypothetical protein